jgi:DNA-binding NarL/FixJ family response regulator
LPITKDEYAIRIAILAPTPALRSGLRAMLAANERSEVTGEGAALSDIDLHAVDVLIAVEGENVTETWRGALAELEAPPALLLITDDPQAARTLAALPVRAWGALPTDTSEDELLAGVLAVHQGLLAAAPALMQPLLGPALELDEDEEEAEELTEREGEVLQLLAQGLANKQIALSLEISEHTVKFHVSSIYAKLGVTNRTEAVRRGARLGLIIL